MKKLLQYIMLAAGLSMSLNTFAQYGPNQFGHEWINVNQQYYKFPISTNGIYRINKAKLREIGWENIPGNQFVLYNKGQEIPLYVTTSGTFSDGDYIMFVGEMDNGDLDKFLFVDTTQFISDDKSIFNDINMYFLSYKTGNNKRITLENNSIPTPTPAPSPYCMVTTGPTTNRGGLWLGPSYSTSETYYSSEYRPGSGFPWAYSSANISYRFSTSGRVAENLNSNLRFKADNVNSGNFDVSFTYNNIVLNSTNVTSNDKTINISALINNATLVNGNTDITLNSPQLIRPNTLKLSYYRNFSFGNNTSNYIYFESTNPDSFFNITYTVAANELAYLYDKTSSKLYISNRGGTLTKQFRTVENPNYRQFYLFKESKIINLASTIEPSNLQYLSKIQEGDYIIFSSTFHITNTLSDYANYRNSSIGGGYQSTIINADSLYDIFAYGKEFHPLAIKKLIEYANANWSTPLKSIFIVGKGITYNQFNTYKGVRQNYNFEPIPTWGYPGTDNYYTNYRNILNPQIPVGRISILNDDELQRYFNKVKAYESNLRNRSNIIANNLWKKRVLHIAGATSQSIQNSLIATLNNAKTIIEDTGLSMNVSTIYKRSTDPVSSVTDASIDSLINNGVRFISFYGHAGASGFDYNLNDPYSQNSKPNYPIFFAYGCEVGQVFALNKNRTATDEYLFSENGGSVAMISSNNLGWTGTIPLYMTNIYRHLSYKSYGKTLGEVYINNINDLLPQSNTNKYLEIHCQSLLLHGDPALQLYFEEQPDYAIENQYIKLKDAKITTDMDSFNFYLTAFNLGKSNNDSVPIVVEHYSNNALRKSDTIQSIVNNNTTINYSFAINAIRDNGLNKIKIILDPDNIHPELFEDNNIAELTFNIVANTVIATYPYQFAITNDRNLELIATTSDYSFTPRKVKFELDTTALFNSNSKQTFEILANPGPINWKPSLNWLNNTVYYWRVALDTLINNQINWDNSSFIFIDTVSKGWNQSHYYQYLYDSLNIFTLTDSNRLFNYPIVKNHYKSTNANIWDGRYKDAADYLNDRELNSSNCQSNMNHGIQISVIDPVSGEPLPRLNPCGTHFSANEFQSQNYSGRLAALNFLKSVPDGYYVSIKNLVHGSGTANANVSNWAKDTISNSMSNSFYHYLRDSVGFTDIVEVTGTRVFCLFFKKNDLNFPLKSNYSTYSGQLISIEADFYTRLDTGTLTSTHIGKSKKWEHFYWNMSAYDTLHTNDQNHVAIYGVDKNNNLTHLTNVTGSDTSLAFIDASIYPKLQLVWHSKDTVNRTSAQLDYWRVHYEPVPEATLAPNIAFSISDTVEQGATNKFKIAIKNISDYDMDSMLVQYRIVDNNNTIHNLDRVRYAPIPKKDSIIVGIDINTDLYPGVNNLFVEANPDDDQLEQYHPNNMGYFKFHVNKDVRNPLLDVTFDGVRILDKDIVSAKPFIKIQLNDENLAKPLSDTSLFELYLAKPSNISNLERIYVDGNVLKFIPASVTNGKNEAYLEFRPTLPEDGIYKLVVKAKDASSNLAGNTSQYDVNFTVVNKSTITNVLNYPNPFSTSTSFIFTLTGSEIPSQFKIQIMSVTGKVVREITKDELGPIHIGRNITEYKWDGKDQFGQTLGNGVYLYRVVTTIKGESIEHKANQNVDKYFKNGYGKLYIMR